MRGRDNVRKRYIAHIAALNLGLVMRTLFGHGTPREAANAVLVVLVAATWRVLRAMEAIGHSVLGIFLPLVTVRPLGTARSMA